MPITEGIFKEKSFGNGDCYYIGCDCHSPDHGFDLVIEFDKEIGDISICGYQDLSWEDYWFSPTRERLNLLRDEVLDYFGIGERERRIKDERRTEIIYKVFDKLDRLVDYYHRLGLAFKVIRTGKVSVSGNTMIVGSERCLNVVRAILESMDKIKRHGECNNILNEQDMDKVDKMLSILNGEGNIILVTVPTTAPIGYTGITAYGRVIEEPEYGEVSGKSEHLEGHLISGGPSFLDKVKEYFK